MADQEKGQAPYKDESTVMSENFKRDPEISEEISLEEYNPKGTLALTLLYFVILSIMWVFMYFIEFAGHGPSIIE